MEFLCCEDENSCSRRIMHLSRSISIFLCLEEWTRHRLAFLLDSRKSPERTDLVESIKWKWIINIAKLRF